jgi:hypothetical protein
VSARFKRTRRGITVTFDEGEITILDTLLRQLLDLLEPGDREAPAQPGREGDEFLRSLGIGAAAEAPADPALARLFPDAYREDPAAAAEFRRYTEQDLREGKRAAARTARATLGAPGETVRLDAEQAGSWLASLNDLRLAIGTRLEVTEDTDQMYGRLPADDPRRPYLDVYMWLGHLQDTLVQALW